MASTLSRVVPSLDGPVNLLRRMYDRMAPLPGGKLAFGHLVGRMAAYTGSIGARVVGEGLALDIVDAFLTAEFEGGRHATRVEMMMAIEG